MLYSMINEGFKVMEDGIVSNPQSIDMGWIYGMAWPKYTGGPMYYANSVGELTVCVLINVSREK